MQTPNKVSPKMLDAFVEAAKDANFCTQCGRPMERVAACISIHCLEFGDDCAVAGGGETVGFVDVPYCPACEPKPNDHGCMHVSFGG